MSHSYSFTWNRNLLQDTLICDCFTQFLIFFYCTFELIVVSWFCIDWNCLSRCVQESEGGLYVCMNTFLGFGREHVERHYRKTGQCVYMHLKRHVKEVRYIFLLAPVWAKTVFTEMPLWRVILYLYWIEFLLHPEINVEHNFSSYIQNVHALNKISL